MELKGIVQIRKKGGLDKIVKDVNSGSTLAPKLFNTKTKSKKEDGVLDGDYKGKQILGTKHFISPLWSDLKKQWSFEGSTQDLSRLIEKMKLRYPKNHPREGELIKPSPEGDGERLLNMSDEVFTHPDLYGKFFMQNGRISLDMNDPKQEFLLRVYKGNPQVQDKSREGPQSKYITAGAAYEIISPKKEVQTAKRNADKEIEAIKLLASMDNDEEKMRAICVAMALPQYSPTTDAAGLFVLLKDVAAQNTNMSAKYNKSYQDRFIELASMKDDELNIISQVAEAKITGLLRKRPGHYLFNGEKLDGLDNDLQLMNYFRNPKNNADYLKLVDLLEGVRK